MRTFPSLLVLLLLLGISCEQSTSKKPAGNALENGSPKGQVFVDICTGGDDVFKKREELELYLKESLNYQAENKEDKETIKKVIQSFQKSLGERENDENAMDELLHSFKSISDWFIKTVTLEQKDKFLPEILLLYFLDEDKIKAYESAFEKNYQATEDFEAAAKEAGQELL